LQIRVFAGAVLGSSASRLTQVRAGAIEFETASCNVLEGSAPVAGIAGLPFVFDDHKAAWDALDGPLGKSIDAAVARLNVHPFGRVWDGAFKVISNNVRPVYTPADLRGLRIRVVPAATLVDSLKAFKASPVPLDAAQVYPACQTHLIDGIDFPLGSVESYKMYEVLKYVSITNFSWVGYVMLANQDAWRRLPQNLQDIVERNMETAAGSQRSDMVKLDATTQDTLRNRGMAVNQADVPSFKAAVRGAGLYAQWRSQYGADAFGQLEKAVGKLT
jgi:tripartite ATP-independent transporter DctP family solute receptor